MNSKGNTKVVTVVCEPTPEAKRVMERQIMRRQYIHDSSIRATQSLLFMTRMVLELYLSYQRNNEYIQVLSEDFHIYMPVVKRHRTGYRVQFVINGLKIDTYIEFTFRYPMYSRRLSKVSQKVSENQVW